MNKFSLSDLSIDEVNMIIVGLLELPGKYTATLLPRIKQQMEAQGVRPAPDSPADAIPQSNLTPPPNGPLSTKVIN